MTTQTEVRKQFWVEHPEFKADYRAKKRQNDYNATIRTTFCNWIDYLQKDGRITEKLAQRVTL